MVQVWFPNLFIRLKQVNLRNRIGVAKLYVEPKMTKFEIKEYLSKIYNVPITGVTTINFLGNWKKFIKRQTKTLTYKRRNYKIARVTFLKEASADHMTPVTFTKSISPDEMLRAYREGEVKQ